MTDQTGLAAKLKELGAVLQPFADSLVAQTNVDHHSQDWRDETDDTVVSISTSHQRKGMPELSPDHTLWVGAFRRAREAAEALPAIIAALEARPSPATEGEVERLRDVASSADRAMRFVELVAGQKLSEPAREWYTGEFGDEGEPDFDGAYDSFIEQARNILNDAPRAALSAARPSREEG